MFQELKSFRNLVVCEKEKVPLFMVCKFSWGERKDNKQFKKSMGLQNITQENLTMTVGEAGASLDRVVGEWPSEKVTVALRHFNDKRKPFKSIF